MKDRTMASKRILEPTHIGTTTVYCTHIEDPFSDTAWYEVCETGGNLEYPKEYRFRDEKTARQAYRAIVALRRLERRAVMQDLGSGI